MNTLKFSKKTFAQLDLPNLLINIWDYAFCHCSISVNIKSGALKFQKKNGSLTSMILITL